MNNCWSKVFPGYQISDSFLSVFILFMLFLKNSYNDFFLLFLITVEIKFLLCLYLSCVSIFFTGSFSLMYLLNKEFLTKIVSWIVAVIYDFVLNFNWYWLNFLNQTCLSSTPFMFKRKSSKEWLASFLFNIKKKIPVFSKIVQWKPYRFINFV